MPTLKYKIDVVSICATFIALMSLFVSLWQLREQRTFSRLQIKPEIIVTQSYHLHIYGYHFENNGLGPAIIDTIYAVIGDSQYHLYSGHDWINVLRKLDLDSQFDGNVDKNIYGRGVAIRTGEKSNLITFEDTLNTGKTKLWNNAIVKLNFKIVYTSIYRDETFTSNSNFSKHPRF